MTSGINIYSKLLISTNTDIKNTLLISRIRILDINIGIVDINNYNYCDAALLISVIPFLDSSNNS